MSGRFRARACPTLASLPQTTTSTHSRFCRDWWRPASQEVCLTICICIMHCLHFFDVKQRARRSSKTCCIRLSDPLNFVTFNFQLFQLSTCHFQLCSSDLVLMNLHSQLHVMGHTATLASLPHDRTAAPVAGSSTMSYTSLP